MTSSEAPRPAPPLSAPPLSVEEARSRILASARPAGTEWVPLSDGWGRWLATDVVARLTHPPADVSSMDGYAVRASDTRPGAALRVVGQAPAGHPYAGSLSPGQAVRLFTGSVIPAGADAVIAQEDTDQGEAIVTLASATPRGRFIRPAGQDFRAGETVLSAGRKLTARDLGLAAAANHPWLPVARPPRVALLATGDEIALPGMDVPTGGIVSSNTHALAAIVRSAGAEPTNLGIAPDQADSVRAVAASLSGFDLLVTTGGASVGTFDLVQSGLSQAGMRLGFWKIAMRPGRPLLFGSLGDTPILGLPGNPVSAVVCALMFLLPLLERMQGGPGLPPRPRRALAGEALPENDSRADHLRATLSERADGTLVATPFARQDSGMLAFLAKAEALVLRAPHAPAVAQGEPVAVIVLGEHGV